MKKTLSIILAILMIVTTIPMAFAADVVASGACGANGDNLTWSLDSDGLLTISGEGKMQAIFSYTEQPWEDYERDIKEVVVEEGVTKIAGAAFYSLSYLEKITIPSTAEFEDFAFCFVGCSSLKEFIVSPANPYYCTDEYGVVFSKDKKTLLKAGDLSDVDYVIPDTVTSVAYQAFREIKIKSIIVNLTSDEMFLDVAIGKLIVDCAYVDEFAFSAAIIGEVVLTNKVREIAYSGFKGSEITSAHYLGDPANLTIDASDASNESLTDVLHYCNYEEGLAPTCTENGYTDSFECNTCDYNKTQEVIPALNHKDTLVQVDAKAPTCTEIGWDAYEYCTACTYTTKVELPVDPDAHDIVIDKAVAPDCANTGLTEGQHCSRCNNATIAQEVIPALNHKDTLVKVDAKAPTCTEIGWDAYEYCTACTYTTYVEHAIDPNAHDIIIDKAVAGDCTNAGLTEGQHCSRCNNATIAQEVIPATGEHIDADGDTMCDNGGEQLTCPDCKRPVHTGFIAEIICFFARTFNLVEFIRNLFAK
ncbi:MAG: leucine-rich repeat protein [Clostridia bacterium]|nr:leucine-rich repeat protein [Clostridia bacterium]